MKHLLVGVSLIILALRSLGGSMDAPHGGAMSAQNLAEAYHRNELDADSRYQGKRVSVGGVVERVGKNEDGDPYVQLEDGILCKFGEAYLSRVARLQPKSAVGITGTVVGLKASTVVLKDCAL